MDEQKCTNAGSTSSDEKRIENSSLLESEARIRVLVCAISHVIYRMNPDWTILNELWGRGFLADTPNPSSSWMDKYIHPDDQSYVSSTIKECIREKKIFELEHRVLRADNTLGWTFSRAIPILDSDGEIIEWVGTTCDISDRKIAEETLQKSEQEALALVNKLESLNKAILQFLDILSHELRNPIATISSGLELLEIAADKDKFDKTKGILLRQIKQLTYLVDELLDHTRISNSKMKLKKEPADLNQLAQLVVEDYHLLYSEKNIKLRINKGNQGSLYINADSQRLRQVVGNLLHNAWKFTDAGGSVILSIYRNNEMALISVKDSGMGIAADMIKTLFEPFIQAKTTPTHNSGGLGLGLAITKEIIQLHNGKIEVHSEGLGKGSEFVISLPIE